LLADELRMRLSHRFIIALRQWFRYGL
jgi:hypothetical protein